MASPAEAPAQTQDQQPPMIGQLIELGFVVVDVSGSESWMGPALKPATGLAGKPDVTRLYGSAFSDLPGAEARLTEASRAAQAAVHNDKGTISAVVTPKQKAGGKQLRSVVVGGVDVDGTVFVGHKSLNNSSERKELRAMLGAVGSSPTQRGGVAANLLNGRSPGNLVGAIGAGDASNPAPRQRRASEPSLIDQLGELDPKLVFSSTYYGYTTPGLSYPEVVLDPDMKTNRRMLQIAELGSTIGSAALGLRPPKAAELFADEPAVWQSLARLGHELPSGETQALGVLVASASERLTARPEQLSVEGIADLVGSALLARRAPKLRPAISARLASIHTRPEPLPEPTPPDELELLSVPKLAFRKKTRTIKAAAMATNIELSQLHAQATTDYNAAKARYNQRTGQIANYDREHPQIEERGGQMLAKLMKWYARRGTSLWESILHADTNANKFSLSDVTDAIQDPAQLRATYDRVRKTRRWDRLQFWYETPKEWAKARTVQAAVGTAHAISTAAHATAALRAHNKQARVRS